MSRSGTIRAVLSLFIGLLLAPCGVSQTMTVFDDFTAPELDAARWTYASLDGTAMAAADTACGYLSIAGRPNRSGVISHTRLPSRMAVEVDALGWTGTNQILQLYVGPTGFQRFIEFFAQGVDPDGTPILRVWLPSGEAYRGRAPTSGLVNTAKPLTLRIERNGTAYRFLANGVQVFQTTTSTLNAEARVFLYGWSDSVSHWDNVRLSGPEVRITAPLPGSAMAGPMNVHGFAGTGTTAWTLEWGVGSSPGNWTSIKTGMQPVNGFLGRWDPGAMESGEVTFRLTATDAQGYSRSYWSTVTLQRARMWEPLNGQVVGPAFSAAVRGVPEGAKVRFYDNGALAAESARAPFWGRILPKTDGAHAVMAAIAYPDGSEIEIDTVNVTVRRDLYGSNARVADDGRTFLFPNGQAGLAIAHQDGYPWPPLNALWNDGDMAAAESYLAMLAANGVNVIRMWLESAVTQGEFLENPIGTYVPKTVQFWDRFLPLCEKYGVTVLISPWETFWINLHWDINPYNAANGGPCATVEDFIVSPVARQAQKNRIKYMVDRWGNSPAIFAYDILNEYDIWWEPATVEERNAWVDDMVRYLQVYELQKWGRRHMVTVSTTKNEPSGGLADTVYRHPLLEFATTHFYYPGTVNNPRNIIDPALSVNHGIRYALEQIQDGRPFTDSEWGPIDLWPTILEQTFDDQYFRHFSWAHFASGGTGTGMRFPNRDPFTLTSGMHAAQKAIAAASADLYLPTFRPENIDSRITTSPAGLVAMGSADEDRAVLWLTQDVRLQPAQALLGATVSVSGMAAGRYLAQSRLPHNGNVVSRQVLSPANGVLSVPLPTMNLDMAVTIQRLPVGDVNADLAVDMQDVALSLRIVGGLERSGAREMLGGDFVEDGRLTLSDPARIARIAAGLEDAP